MDALAYIHDDVSRQAVTCEIWRDQSDGPYDDSLSDTGETVDVAIFSPTSQSQVVAEGSGQEATFVGVLVPEEGRDGTLQDPVRLNDQLRPVGSARRYDVRTKDGVPNDLNPELWQLGLDRANSSG